MRIDTNNGRYLQISFGNKKIIVLHYESNGTLDKVDMIEEGDIVSLINYYNYQKSRGEELI